MGATPSDSALVLHSGGQDSTTCLAWALDRFSHVETIAFDYGQRHKVELDCRVHVVERIRRDLPHWNGRLADDHLIDLGVLGQLSETALTRDIAIEWAENGLPNTFVPGRNILFLTLAATLAYRRGISSIVAGMCETDFSGYPDCRDDAVKALQVALNIGMAARFCIHTPLMWLDKAATWQLADDLGGAPLVDIIVQETHTCYHGDRGRLHAWGYGCGCCPACRLRASGFEAYHTNRPMT